MGTKMECLVTDKVTSNLGTVEAQLVARLKIYRCACDKINKILGADIRVDYSSDFKYLNLIAETI